MVRMRIVSRKIARWTQVILLVVFAALVCAITENQCSTYQVQQNIRELQAARLEASSAADWSNGLLSINADYAGWLEVDGTQVSCPVVRGTDNFYYLAHDFYGAKSRHGCLFLDADCGNFSKGNLLIYGHNMKDGTMFGELDFYKDPSFWQEHNAVKWTDETGEHIFRLFAALVIPGNAGQKGYLDLSEWMTDLSEERMQEMLETLENRAFLWQSGLYRSELRYLFLVTCDYTKTDGRLVLVAQEIDSQ